MLFSVAWGSSFGSVGLLMCELVGLFFNMFLEINICLNLWLDFRDIHGPQRMTAIDFGDLLTLKGYNCQLNTINSKM